MEYAVLVTIFWSLVGFAAFFKTLIPPDFFRLVDDLQRKILQRWSLFHEIIIAEQSSVGTNELYTYAHFYSATLKSTAEALTAECPKNSKLSFAVAPGQQVSDNFRGGRFKWEFVVDVQENNYHNTEKRSYRLTVAKADKDLVPDYLEFVMERGKEIEKTKVEKNLHTNIYDYWESIPFNPPSTFDSMAMDPEQKKLLVNDLAKFMKGKEFYASVGRAWKRGYLLYGPPGTGKSSLISAIANFTGYDVYDLELTKVKDNMELRQLLITVKDRAIIIVEDIDCSVFTGDRKKKKNIEKLKKRTKKKMPEVVEDQGVTLSGLLNFTDGLWSSCGSERLFIFTTNYVKRLDPALLRPGRMDMHIHMSYCSFAAFKSLASTYLKIQEHHLFDGIEALLGSVKITPASVVEELLRHGDDPTKALESLVKTLSERRESQQQQEVDDELSCSDSDSGSDDSSGRDSGSNDSDDKV